MSHGNLQSTCHCHLYEWCGPARYLSLSLVWTMGPCKVPVTENCMNHGALQGTYHWELYEPWGPARYQSLRLVWTMGPWKVPVTETCTNQGALQNRYTCTAPKFVIMQMDHDGDSLSLCFHGFVSEYDDDQDFILRWIFLIAAMSRQINQPTNQWTRPTFCTTSIYRILHKSWQLLGGQDSISAFTKPDSSSAHSQNPTLYPHIESGEYNQQPDIYFYNTELVSPPSRHNFQADKFPHFLNRNVSAILIFSTQLA
jgi:hypothetical protein